MLLNYKTWGEDFSTMGTRRYLTIFLIISSSANNSFVLFDGMGKAYGTTDSRVSGNFRTIDSILSHAFLALLSFWFK